MSAGIRFPFFEPRGSIPDNVMQSGKRQSAISNIETLVVNPSSSRFQLFTGQVTLPQLFRGQIARILNYVIQMQDSLQTGKLIIDSVSLLQRGKPSGNGLAYYNYPLTGVRLSSFEANIVIPQIIRWDDYKDIMPITDDHFDFVVEVSVTNTDTVAAHTLSVLSSILYVIREL